MPNYKIEGQSITTQKCFQGNSFTPDIYYKTLLLCNETIYSISFNEASDGIYAFISLLDPKDNCAQLSDRLYILSNVISNKENIDIISNIQTSIVKYSSILNSSNYFLLHGDLHPGNIVLNNEVKIIDWEYSRFGLIELEVAYFSIMSSFTQIGFCYEYIKKSILFLEKHFYTNSIDLYLKIFYPLLLCSIYHYKSIGVVSNRNITLENYNCILKAYRTFVYD